MQSDDLDSNTKTQSALKDDAPEDAERRAALARLGTMAAWTAPAILTLVASRRASASSTSSPPTTPNF